MQCRVNKHKFTAKIWTKSDPFPVLATSVGVDTETTLIDQCNNVPQLAYMGVYNPYDNTAYIIRHTDAMQFLHHMCQMNVVQYYFNAAFDFLVLTRRCQTSQQQLSLLVAADTGRIIDVGVRAQLHSIATLGYVQQFTYNLKGMCKHLLNYFMDKGEDKGQQADRLTFSPDKQITDSQTVYLGIDCYCTFACGDIQHPMPTEYQHTLGSIVLGYIQHNGLNIDMRIWQYFQNGLIQQQQKYRKVLIDFGFPDPFKPKQSPSAAIQQRLMQAYCRFMRPFYQKNMQLLLPQVMPPKLSKAQICRMLVYMENVELQLIHQVYHAIVCKDKSMTKIQQQKFQQLCLKYDIGFYAASSKNFLLRFILAVLLQHVLQGDTMQHAMQAAQQQLSLHAQWYAQQPKVGPKKFLQQHLEKLQQKFPTLQLPTTQKSKQLKLAKDDMWRLQDLGINDPFINAYVAFGHARKYLSTYMNRQFIAPDMRIHPRFTNILRTGRTSCSNPNVQNLPSRQKVYSLKNMYCPPPGAILCATDFSFVQLCAFAQACYTRFGASAMRDIINAGVDPHRWFAGVMYKVIGAQTDRMTDPQYVDRLSAKLKQTITDSQRQLAKAANFGLPGGMSGKRFYMHCRSSGISISMQQACTMRQQWIRAFPQMKKHMKPQQAIVTKHDRKFLAYRIDGEDDQQSQQDIQPGAKRNCSATLINGFVRNKCSFNSALNIQFQGITAAGAKLAGWQLVKLGMGPRLYNFVHFQLTRVIQQIHRSKHDV